MERRTVPPTLEVRPAAKGRAKERARERVDQELTQARRQRLNKDSVQILARLRRRHNGRARATALGLGPLLRLAKDKLSPDRPVRRRNLPEKVVNRRQFKSRSSLRTMPASPLEPTARSRMVGMLQPS